LGETLSLLKDTRLLRDRARQRLREQGVTNANIICGDGLAISDLGSFDRILVNLALGDMPLTLQALLNPGGVLVFALSASAPGCKKQQLIKVTKSLLAGFVSEHIGVTRLTASCIGSSQTM
jgi:protein-L-isoaspartate(D-aspartate) O-methyltransferase